MSTTLKLESLDLRDLPSLFGVAWPNAASGITLSFANDGAQSAPSLVGSSSPPTSVLQKHLNSSMTTAQWQEQILRAFAVWAAPANINIGIVPDNTRPFGSDGAFDTTAAAGEIRIGGIPQSNEIGAVSTPYSVLAGPRSGDVLFNTNQRFNIGGTNGSRDLFTIMMNEAGNVLGLEDNNDKGSARYGRYTGVRSGLSTNDFNDIRALYGARPNDGFEGTMGNNTTTTASMVNIVTLGGTMKGFSVDGAIPTTSDVDVYRFTSPSGTESLTVNLDTAGKSLFTGTVEVLNSEQQVIATRSVTSPLQGDIDFNVPASSSTTYFIRVTSARTDAFGVGIYSLQVGINGNPKSLPAAASPVPSFGADNNTDDFIQQARVLTVTTPGHANGTHLSARGYLEGFFDRDTYRVTVPNTGRPMTVTVVPELTQTISPEVSIFRPGYQWVEPIRLVNSNDGFFTAQVPGLVAGEQVYLTVANANGEDFWGHYRLNVDFKSPLVDLRRLVEGKTTTADSRHDLTMAVPESTVFHFLLESTLPGSFGTGTHTQVTIRNAQNQVMAQLRAGNGSNSTQVMLPAGQYQIQIQGQDFAGNNRGGASYKLSAARISDPIDVYDPNDTCTQTPPVVITRPNPQSDWDVYYISDPWSELIG